MILKISAVSFGYDSRPVLRDVSFEVAAGESIGVLGPNGSGKTTLLRCINRNLEPHQGVVTLDGRDLAETARTDIARAFGVVPQESSLEFPFSVQDVVRMGRYAHRGPGALDDEIDLRAVHDAMRVTDMLRFADRSFFELSGGERQRVIVARALAQEPKVLLLDEPTLHLDPRARIEIMECIAVAARGRGLLVVLVTHDVNLAIRYCTRFVLLKEGRIHLVGNLDEVMTEADLSDIFGLKATLHPGPGPGRPTVWFSAGPA